MLLNNSFEQPKSVDNLTRCWILHYAKKTLCIRRSITTNSFPRICGIIFQSRKMSNLRLFIISRNVASDHPLMNVVTQYHEESPSKSSAPDPKCQIGLPDMFQMAAYIPSVINKQSSKDNRKFHMTIS